MFHAQGHGLSPCRSVFPNPKGAQLDPPEGQSLNENGELIDRWGTPYFFHQLSKDLMEIHSAGPDRRMGNEDDLIGD